MIIKLCEECWNNIDYCLCYDRDEQECINKLSDFADLEIMKNEGIWEIKLKDKENGNYLCISLNVNKDVALNEVYRWFVENR